MADESSVACPRCGQEWLRNVRLVRFERPAVHCQECDALWIDVTPGKDNFEDYGTFMRRGGVMEPDAAAEIQLLGLYRSGTRR